MFQLIDLGFQKKKLIDLEIIVKKYKKNVKYMVQYSFIKVFF